MANANISQHDLITWLDAQEQKPFLRVAPIDKTVEAFDRLHRGCGDGDFAIPARIEESKKSMNLYCIYISMLRF